MWGEFGADYMREGLLGKADFGTANESRNHRACIFSGIAISENEKCKM